MRKLIEMTFISLDGVISAPEKWSGRHWDEQSTAFSKEPLFAADAMLFGRETYEGFAAVWPQMEEAEGEYAVRMNSLPKYVASRTLPVGEAAWNATVLDGDIAKEVARLKEQPGGNILKFGTGELDRTLLDHKLVDEYHFWMFPTIVGSGDRLLDGLDTTHLKLVKSTSFGCGVVVLAYAPE